MSNFKDMPLDTTLQKGDVVTISGPGEHDVLVREVTDCSIGGGHVEINGMVGQYANLVVVMERDDRTLTRIQRPVPALPTVEGDYILDMGGGERCLIELTDKGWRTAMGNGLAVSWLAPRVREGATLTRVIPADEAKHPEVDMVKAREAFAATYSDSIDDPDDDFEAVLIRVLNGEFDK